MLISQVCHPRAFPVHLITLRRIFVRCLLLSLLMIVGLASIAPAVAEDYPRTQMRVRSTELLTTLEKMPWASEGSGTPVYVFEFSECPYCQKFNQDHSAAIPGIEMRHMFYAVSQRSANETAALAKSRDIADYRAFMVGRKRAPAYDSTDASIDAFNAIQVEIGDVIMPVLKANGWSNKSLVSPMFFYVENGKLWAQGGYETGAFDRFVARIADGSQSSASTASQASVSRSSSAAAAGAAGTASTKATSSFDSKGSIKQAPPLQDGQRLTYTNSEDKKLLLSRMDNALWAADDEPLAKHMYVIYSPSCGWSKKLYDDTRTLTDEVQLRWVTYEGPGSSTVAAKRDARSVQSSFEGRLPETPDRKALFYNKTAVGTIYDYLEDGDGFGYPTVIYLSQEGVVVVSGYPEDLDALVADIKPRPKKASYTPGGLKIINTNIDVQRLPGISRYANLTNATMPIQAFPGKAGIKVGELPPETSLPMTGVVKSGWVAVRAFTGNTVGYIHDPQFVKLSTMKINVKPERGDFSALDRDYDVRSHPTKEAPVVSQIERGYMLDKTGRVGDWVQVIYFTDGTKGYVYSPR
jgi:hypothetical protein